MASFLSATPPDNWKRPPGRPRITWLNTVQRDLRAYKLRSVAEARVSNSSLRPQSETSLICKRLKPRFRSIVPFRWQMQTRNSALSPWRILCHPELWCHSRRICFVYICLSWSCSDLVWYFSLTIDFCSQNNVWDFGLGKRKWHPGHGNVGSWWYWSRKDPEMLLDLENLE